MEGKEYIFFPQDSNYRFWQLDKDRKLFLSADTYKLEQAPIAWDEMAIENNRNDKYFGIDRTLAAALIFIKDGAIIIKSVLHTLGSEADFYMVIAQREWDIQPGVKYGAEYKYRYRGKGNLGSYRHNGPKVTIDFLEEGITKYFKANESTAYEINMNVPESIHVKMDGVKLHNTIHYSLLNYTIPHDVTSRAVPVFLGIQEGDSSGLVFVNQQDEDTGVGPNLPVEPYYTNSDNYFIKNTSDNLIIIDIAGNLNFSKSDPVQPYAFWFEESGGVIHRVLVPGSTGSNFSIPYAFTIALEPNEKLFLFDWFGHGDITHLAGSEFTIKVITRRDPTYVLHLPPQYVFNYLVNKVTDGAYTAAASALLNQFKTITFTCGDSIREVKDENGNIKQIMKLSFWDFFQFWDYNFNCGITERNGQIVLEKKEDLIDKTNVIKLGQAALTPSFEINKASLFNEYEYGYPDISSEVGVLNGRQEYNCKVLRSLGTVANPKKISRVCTIRTSCYEQEKLRTAFLKKDTTDSNKDNLVYANHIDGTLQPASGSVPMHYTLDRTQNASITSGLLEPGSVWNLFLRPELMLQRNGSFIRSSFYKCDTMVLKFISGDRNTDLEVNGQRESVDYNIGSFAAPYILPYWQTADFPAPDDLMQNLDINPLQVFETTLDGIPSLWIGKKITSGSNKKKLQNYVLISLGSNDFTHHINYEG